MSSLFDKFFKGKSTDMDKAEAFLETALQSSPKYQAFRRRHIFYSLFKLVVFVSGFFLIGKHTDWQTCVGVFLVLWGNNSSRSS